LGNAGFFDKGLDAIARTLVNQRQLILADEPIAALDEQSGRDVVRLMQHQA
jgi:putative ABC transport system ATP-binding protein